MHHGSSASAVRHNRTHTCNARHTLLLLSDALRFLSDAACVVQVCQCIPRMQHTVRPCSTPSRAGDPAGEELWLAADGPENQGLASACAAVQRRATLTVSSAWTSACASELIWRHSRVRNTGLSHAARAARELMAPGDSNGPARAGGDMRALPAAHSAALAL